MCLSSQVPSCQRLYHRGQTGVSLTLNIVFICKCINQSLWFQILEWMCLQPRPWLGLGHHKVAGSGSNLLDLLEWPYEESFASISIFKFPSFLNRLHLMPTSIDIKHPHWMLHFYNWRSPITVFLVSHRLLKPVLSYTRVWYNLRTSFSQTTSAIKSRALFVFIECQIVNWVLLLLFSYG